MVHYRECGNSGEYGYKIGLVKDNMVVNMTVDNAAAAEMRCQRMIWIILHWWIRLFSDRDQVRESVSALKWCYYGRFSGMMVCHQKCDDVEL